MQTHKQVSTNDGHIHSLVFEICTTGNWTLFPALSFLLSRLFFFDLRDSVDGDGGRGGDAEDRDGDGRD